jgi:hypothetical protein
MSLADLVLAEAQLPDDPPDTDHTPDAPPDWQALDRPDTHWHPLDRPAPDWHADRRADDEPIPRTCLTRPSALERHYEHLLALAA